MIRTLKANWKYKVFLSTDIIKQYSCLLIKANYITIAKYDQIMSKMWDKAYLKDGSGKDVEKKPHKLK